MSELYTKHVEFNKWCSSCAYADSPESESPCDECLEVPAREDSHKPIRWTPAKGNRNKASNKYSC